MRPLTKPQNSINVLSAPAITGFSRQFCQGLRSPESINRHKSSASPSYSTLHNIHDSYYLHSLLTANLWVKSALTFLVVLALSTPNSALAQSNQFKQGQVTASWYSTRSCLREGTNGYFTASGSYFDEQEMTCASPNLPFGTKVLVTNKRNGKHVVVTCTDRGPNKRLVAKGRLLDLSRGAFSQIASLSDGVIPISMEVL